MCERYKNVLLRKEWQGVGMLWTNTRWMHLVSMPSIKGRLDKLRHTRVGFLWINPLRYKMTGSPVRPRNVSSCELYGANVT